MAKPREKGPFRKEYARAESCYQALASCSEAGWRTTGRTYLAFVPLYQGKFEAALEALDNGIAADRMAQQQQVQYGYKHYLRAVIHAERGSFDLALREYEVCLEIMHKVNYDAPVYGREYQVKLLARKGDFEKAEEVARDLKRDIEANDESRMGSYWYAAGWIDFEKGDYEASVTAFEKSAEGATSFYRRYMLGRAYLESGRLGEAVATLEKALARYDGTRATGPLFAVKAYYLLGLAYEKSGWNKKAIESYEEFLDIWKDADPGIPEIEDARQRLTRIKSGA
jgi:tetratricopeptide (TPR) repeat protein